MDEYIAEREIINLEKDLLSVGYESHWYKIRNNRDKKLKSGYNYTKLILIGVNIIVCFIGLTGAFIVQIASVSPVHADKPVHIFIDSAPKLKGKS